VDPAKSAPETPASPGPPPLAAQFVPKEERGNEIEMDVRSKKELEDIYQNAVIVLFEKVKENKFKLYNKKDD
jgi:hypothetical protein